MKHIGNLTYAPGSRKKTKRIGRGQGSGYGGTATRGHKGHKARSGFNQIRGFEGGQMPLSRRVPKFGFTNPFRTEYQVVNVSRLQELADASKLEDGVVTAELLYSLGVLSSRKTPLKILGNGEISASLKITAHKVSKSAKEKIESAGGTVTVNE